VGKPHSIKPDLGYLSGMPNYMAWGYSASLAPRVRKIYNLREQHKFFAVLLHRNKIKCEYKKEYIKA